MREAYIVKLALKNLTGHRLRSLLTVSGIAIGVGFIVFLVSLGYGLQRISTQQIANLEALQMIDVTPGKSQIIKIDDEAVSRLSQFSDVSEVAPQLDLVGSLTMGSSTVEGVVYAKNNDYIKLENITLSAGNVYEDDEETKLLINEAMMRQLGYENAGEIIDQKIDVDVGISTEYLEKGAKKVVFHKGSYVISGVLANESSPYAYMPLSILKDEGVERYSAARVKVKNKDVTDKVKQQFEGLGYKTVTLKDTVDQINQFFAIFQLVLLSFGAIAVLVAALGMFNTLTISLLEKTREVSYMKVLGTTSNDIWKIFLGEALLIGLIGTLVGVLFGVLAGDALNTFLAGLAERTGNKPVEIFYTPISFLVIIFSVSMLISFLTGIYPSYRASKIDALEALRYE